MEIWKDINEYIGKYQISNLGRVKSLVRARIFNTGVGVTTEKILSPGKTGFGYPFVRLRKEGKYFNHRIHRLVAEAFIPNPNNYPVVNHKDENPCNNQVENLEWCTYQYNKEYSSSKNYQVKSPDGELVEIFNLSKFCRDNDLYRRHIWEVINGRRKQHKGYTIWKS